MHAKSLHAAIDRYFEIECEIKEALGWKDSWKILPLNDNRSRYWMLAGGNKSTGQGSIVVTSDEPFTRANVEAGKVIYGSEIYTQRDHERWIFRAGGVVLTPVDTQTDGNIFLYLLDVEKEVVDEELENIYLDCWGGGA